MTLMNLPVGTKAQIIGLRGGFKMQRHLISLGILPGKIIQKIVTQPIGGPIIVEVERIRIAIGRGIARRIIVRGII